MGPGHLALIRPLEHTLVLHIIGFPDEVRKLEDAVPPREVADALELMRLLVEAMTRPFAEGEYPDRRREAVLELVNRKVEEGEIHSTPTGVRPEGGGRGDSLHAYRREGRRGRADGDAAAKSGGGAVNVGAGLAPIHSPRRSG